MLYSLIRPTLFLYAFRIPTLLASPNGGQNTETGHQNQIETGCQVPQGIRGKKFVIVTGQKPKAQREISTTP